MHSELLQSLMELLAKNVSAQVTTKQWETRSGKMSVFAE